MILISNIRHSVDKNSESFFPQFQVHSLFVEDLAIAMDLNWNTVLFLNHCSQF